MCCVWRKGGVSITLLPAITVPPVSNWSPENMLSSVVLGLSQLLEAFIIASYPSFDVEEGVIIHCLHGATPTSQPHPSQPHPSQPY